MPLQSDPDVTRCRWEKSRPLASLGMTNCTTHNDKLHHAHRSNHFSFRQLTEPRFSTVLDSISMSKPLRSRYFSVITWPVPSSDTP